MKFVTYEYNEDEAIGVLSRDEKSIYSIEDVFKEESFSNMISFISSFKEEWVHTIVDYIERGSKGIEIKDVKILSPIKKPPHDIICLGVNYQDHLEESKKAMKTKSLDEVSAPVYFTKRTSGILGPETEIDGHLDMDNYLDYEVELAVIIGKKGKDIPKDKVRDHIFGYSIFNDFSARKLQKQHTQWYKGKSLDDFSVMGPCILHSSQTSSPYHVDIMTMVNGEMRQQSNTNMLIHSIEEIIADFSRGITLEPGDIIITGTPAGVGMGMNPPGYLNSGDEVECHIDGIGVLRNRIK